MVKRFAVVLVLVTWACRHDMYERPERRPLGSSEFFPDRSASRPLVADTVPREAPPRISLDVERGRERFEIFCAPCHGRTGDGNGIIVQHGFPKPPSFTSRAYSAAEIVQVIATGRNTMYSYADRVPQSDRWAIAAYIGWLQSEKRR